MSVTWRRLAGDTASFAIELELQTDPDEALGASPETAASWGAFRLWVEGQNLCTHTVAGASQDAVHWYLLPLLEWLAEAWDPLLHEERTPTLVEADDAAMSRRMARLASAGHDDEAALAGEERWHAWWARHALAASRAGGLFPSVYLRRWRDLVEVSWDAEPAAGAPDDLRFTFSRGTARLLPSQVAGPLFEASHAAAGELAARMPGAPRIRELLRALEELSDAARTTKRLSWMLDAASGTGGAAGQWMRVKQALDSVPARASEAALAVGRAELAIEGSCHAALLFGAVSPEIAPEDVAELARILTDAYNPDADLDRLPVVAGAAPVGRSAQPAWAEGYELAEEVLDDLSVEEGWIDVERALATLGIDLVDLSLTDTAIRGVSIAGERHRPTVCVNTLYRDGDGDEVRRFTMAHELCHLLFDRGHDDKLALASGPWAPRDVERRANAFAAMLLMPLHLVHSAAAGAEADLATIEGVTHVAARLRTSVSATIQHLANLQLLDGAARERLREQWRWQRQASETGAPES